VPPALWPWCIAVECAFTAAAVASVSGDFGMHFIDDFFEDTSCLSGRFE
jgi:hypothetical protein